MAFPSILQKMDISGLIAALALSAGSFDMKRSWLRHRSTGHQFWFGRDGRLKLAMSHGCTFVSVSRDQAQRLSQAYKAWKDNYWHPIERARELAREQRKLARQKDQENMPVIPGA